MNGEDPIRDFISTPVHSLGLSVTWKANSSHPFRMNWPLLRGTDLPVVINGHHSGLEAKRAVIPNESKGVLVNSSSSSDYRSIVHAVHRRINRRQHDGV